MATAASAGNNRAFSIGEVVGRAFGVMGDNPIATFGIAFLFGALPQQLYSYFLRSLRVTDAQTTLAMSALSIGSILIFLFCSMLVQGALVRATLAYSEGERASVGESVSAGAAKALPLIGLLLLMGLALMLGFVLFVVPAILLYVRWAVATPALVAEDTGVIEAFGRSSFLTKGARWRIFGLQLLLVVLFWIVSAVAGLLLVMIGGLQATAAQLASGQLPVFYMIGSVIAGTLMSAFMGTVQTSLYIALRDWKDGPQVEALGDIFA